MKFLELLSYMYFGSPKYWDGLPVPKKKRAVIKISIATFTILLCIVVGLVFIFNNSLVRGIVMLAAALLFFILMCCDFHKMKQR